MKKVLNAVKAFFNELDYSMCRHAIMKDYVNFGMTIDELRFHLNLNYKTHFIH